MDGVAFGEHTMIGAVGVDSQGRKHVLGIREGATENATVVMDLREDIVTQGAQLCSHFSSNKFHGPRLCWIRRGGIARVQMRQNQATFCPHTTRTGDRQTLHIIDYKYFKWCREGGSNPHGHKGRQILSLLRLPVPPSRLGVGIRSQSIAQALPRAP
jgi:hypothetical protein